ncbi:MAG: hypothetical protein ACJA1C_000465 [Crocinitomicaceae bacterium]|jgi:hypothetical protein
MILGVSIMFWCFVISGVILNFSNSSDFNYSKGRLEAIEQSKRDVKGRYGHSKIGTSYQVNLLLNTSKTRFYIDNNFASQQNSYLKQIKSSKVLEIWSDGELLDGSRQRIYKMKGDGATIIDFESTKSVYVGKTLIPLYFASIFSLISLILFYPKWFLKMIRKEKEEEESLVEFYLEKFNSRKTDELENIVLHPTDFNSDAVIAAKQTLKNRGTR